MWHATALTSRLGLRYPIVQGPFGGGLSTPQLTATVSNAGGLGSFGANNLAPEQIRATADTIRSLTNQPFALNLWVSNHDSQMAELTQEVFAAHLSRLKPYFDELGLDLPSYPERFGYTFDEQIGALLEARPPVFSFIYGIPSGDVLAACRRSGIITIGTATTVDEALALQEAQVDLIVASGFEAGGHRAAFLRPAAESLIGTLALVPQVVDRVTTPVIAAGGIADGRGIAAALMLGAQGVQVGTAFLACDESGASADHRALLFTESARDTTLTRLFSGRLARGVRNRVTRELHADEQSVAPYPAQSWMMQQIRQAAIAQGRSDLIAMWAGQSASLVRYRHAADLFAALLAETDAALGRLAGPV